jgi:hypothetical protein
MAKSHAVAGYIYAIQSPENPRHVKLGLSSNPQARLRALQTGNPFKLQLIWTFACPNMAALEDKFHQVFDKYRIDGGEWFDFHPINNPEHIAGFLDILAYKNLAPNVPKDMRARLDQLEQFIDSPAKFLSSQKDVDELLARQFPDLQKYEGDPEALEAYILRNLKRH